MDKIKSILMALKNFLSQTKRYLLRDMVDTAMLVFITLVGMIGVTTDMNLTWVCLPYGVVYVMGIIFRLNVEKDKNNG